MPQRKTALGITNVPIVIEDEENGYDDNNDNKI
jgi:hypothetical protein